MTVETAGGGGTYISSWFSLACKGLGNGEPMVMSAAEAKHQIISVIIDRCGDSDKRTREFTSFAVGNAANHNNSSYDGLGRAIPQLTNLLLSGGEEDKTKANAAGYMSNLELKHGEDFNFAIVMSAAEHFGIELPGQYKWIESQAHSGCSNEAWKRTHWIGTQMQPDATESVAQAEDYLQTIRPVRRKHGKILEEGASGFLEKRIVAGESSGGETDVPPSFSNADTEDICCWLSLACKGVLL